MITPLLLSIAGAFGGLLVMAFRDSYRNLANTPTSEIWDQAQDLSACLAQRWKETVCLIVRVGDE